MFFTIHEMFDIIVMSLAVGFIFSDLASRFKPQKDPLLDLSKGYLNWDDLKFSVLATAPAVLFHELSHKFLALGYGMQATFNAAYGWLGLGVILKLLKFPFIFFVPAYISISGNGTPLQHALIAVAGPAMNGFLWLLSFLFLKSRTFKRKYDGLLFLTGKINMFLFIFNLLPIPGFDGFTFYTRLFAAFS
ncbi:MAG: M50 family metallopeptidase [Candidatus Woesearchaeota archaeon]